MKRRCRDGSSTLAFQTASPRVLVATVTVTSVKTNPHVVCPRYTNRIRRDCFIARRISSARFITTEENVRPTCVAHGLRYVTTPSNPPRPSPRVVSRVAVRRGRPHLSPPPARTRTAHLRVSHDFRAAAEAANVYALGVLRFRGRTRVDHPLWPAAS